MFWLLSNGIITKQRNIMPTHVASSCICALGLTFRPNCRCHVWVLSGSTTTSPRCICIFCGSGMYLLIARLVKSSLNKTLLTDWLTGCQDWRRGYGLWCISYGDFGGILEILGIVKKATKKHNINEQLTNVTVTLGFSKCKDTTKEAAATVWLSK